MQFHIQAIIVINSNQNEKSDVTTDKIKYY